MTTAWTRMNEVSWPRVAPAARSSPSSRIRSTTVIDSVLKMRNAPANRATAAMSAVVAANSPVDARSAAPRSRGEDARYGRVDDRRLEGLDDAAAAWLRRLEARGRSGSPRPYRTRPGRRPAGRRRHGRSRRPTARRRPGCRRRGTVVGRGRTLDARAVEPSRRPSSRARVALTSATASSDGRRRAARSRWRG